MPSNVQHKDAWSMHVSSACTRSIKEEVETKKAEDSKTFGVVHHDRSLTERDYIGLSVGPSAPTNMNPTVVGNLTLNDSSKCPDSRDDEPECGDTELRLGIGPFNGDMSSSLATQYGGHLVQSAPHQHVFPQSQILKQSEDGLNAHYQCHGGVSGASTVEFHESFWPRESGVQPGRFRIPVPKISTIPAKRPYLEVMGGSNKASLCNLATNPNALEESVILERPSHNISSSASPLTSASSQGGGFYMWSPSTSMPPNVVRGAWQLGKSNQEGIVVASPAKNSYPTSSLPSPPLFKTSPAPQVGQMPPMMSNSSGAPHVSSSEERAVLTLEVHKDDLSRNKSPMVGWPPLRSSRKNILQSAAKGNGASPDVQNREDTSKANESASDQQMKGSVKDALFVKAKLDGVRIGRKVDVASYGSYDNLKSALQEMFQGYVCNDNAKLDLLHGENYVLTHEDKDGDTMLVGDVPWRMFITTVKSLRIMKAVDAVGLGGKVFTKLKKQD